MCSARHYQQVVIGGLTLNDLGTWGASNNIGTQFKNISWTPLRPTLPLLEHWIVLTLFSNASSWSKKGHKITLFMEFFVMQRGTYVQLDNKHLSFSAIQWTADTNAEQKYRLGMHIKIEPFPPKLDDGMGLAVPEEEVPGSNIQPAAIEAYKTVGQSIQWSNEATNLCIWIKSICKNITFCMEYSN